MSLYITSKINHTTSGLIGEHIATAAILGRGWACAMVQQDGFDLVAINDQDAYRVQVKSCRITARTGNRKSLQFPLGIGKEKRLPKRGDYDILACVSTEMRCVYFVPIFDIDVAKYTLKQSYFNPQFEQDSWEYTIQELTNEKKITKSPSLRYNRSRDGSSRNRIVSPPKRRGS